MATNRLQRDLDNVTQKLVSAGALKPQGQQTRTVNTEAVSKPSGGNTATYRQAVAQPVTQPKQWKVGMAPTNYGQALASIGNMARTDKAGATAKMQQLRTLRATPSSMFFNPYASATSSASRNLASYGIDSSQLNDDWFNANPSWQDHLIYNGTTNTPSKPGKRASQEQKIAYELFQFQKSEEDTKQAEREWKAMQEEIAYWTNRKDLNLSDEQVLNRVKKNMKNYPMLQKISDTLYTQPIEFNRAIGYNEDAMRGAIWAARNNGGTGNSDQDIARYYLGEGNTWNYNKEIAEKLDPKSDNYAPYSVGTTNLDEAALYFGVDSFGPTWLVDNDGMQFGDDATQAKMYNLVYNGEENWQKASAELAELDKYLASRLKNAKDPKKVMENLDWSDYPTLAKMNETTGYTDINGNKVVGTGNLIPMSRGLDYSYKQIQDRVIAVCETNNGKLNGDDTINSFTSPAQETVEAKPTRNVEFVQPNEPLPENIIEGTATPEDIQSYADSLIQEETEEKPSLGASIPKDSIIGSTATPSQAGGRKSPGKVLVPGEEEEAPEEEEDVEAKRRKAFDEKYGEGEYDRVMALAKGEEPPQREESAQTTQNTTAPQTTPAPTTTGNAGIQQTEAVQNETVREGAEALDASMTLAERRFFQNVPGVEYDRTREGMIQGPLNPALWQDPDFKGYNFRKSEAKRNQEYLDTLIGNAETINSYEGLQKDAEELQETLRGYEEKYGDQIYAGEEVPEQISYTLSNGMHDIAYLNPETGEYESTLLSGESGDTLEELAFRQGMEYTEGLEGEIQEHVGRANSYAKTVADANEKYGTERPEGMPTLQEINDMHDRLENMNTQIEDGREAYDAAVSDNEKALNRKAAMDRMLIENGFDAQDSANFKAIADAVVNVGGWQEPDSHPLSLSTQLVETYSAGGNGGRTAAIEYANKESAKLDESIADAKYLLNYAENVPEEYKEGIQNYISYLESQKMQYEYLKFSFNEKIDEWAERGRAKVEATASHVGFWQMSDNEWKIYYGLAGRYGEDVAEKYYKDIEPSLIARSQAVIDENAKEIAESGAGGRLLNLFVGIGIAPVDVLASAVDLVHTAVTGEGNDWLRLPSHLSQSAYSADIAAVNEAYKDNPALQKVASMAYEIAYNRGRSAMVGATFGWLFPEGTSEVFQAMPIALTAADETLQKYLGAGVDPAKAGVLAGIAFLSESMTEGIELSHIKSAFSLGKDITRNSLVTFFGNYIPNALPEIVGESVNDIAEKMADYWIAGDKGDLRGLMQKYLDDGTAANEDEAYEMMMRDQISDVAHTALVSLFSPMADLGGVALGEIASYTDYAKKARTASNLTGQNVSVRDLRNGDIATIKAANAAAEAYGNREAGAFNFGDRPVMPDITTGALNAEQVQGNSEQYEIEMTVLDGIGDSDATTQAATMGAVLEMGNGDANKGGATAASISDVFGDDAIATVQNILSGGWIGNININSLKAGIQQAVLGNGRARNVVTSAAFQNADPETQAKWIAEAGAEDAVNPDVQKQVNDAVHDYRVAVEEKRLLMQGAAKPALDAKAKARASAKANELAKADLEARQAEFEAKGQALEAAQADLQKNPGDHAKADQVTHAVGEVTKANEVVTEYEQQAENAQTTADKDADDAKRVSDETMANVRQQAEVTVAQQEQAEAEQRAVAEAEAQAEQQRQAEEAAEQAVARAGENSANHADREAFVEQWQEEHPGATAEDLQHIREVWDQAHQEAVMNSPILQPLIDKEGKFTEKGLKARDKIVKHIGQKFNVGISYASTDQNAENYDPRLIGNGYYNPETRQIVLNQNVSANDAVYVFLGHELTHVAEASGTYNEMADSLLRLAYGKDAQGYQEAIENLKKNGGKASTRMEADLIEGYYNRYRNQLGEKVDYEYAMQEMVADYMGTLIKPNSEAERMDMVDRLVADNPSVARRIMDAIKNFIKKVTGVEDTWLDDARHTVDLFESALKSSTEQQTTTEQTAAEAQPITDEQGNETEVAELRGGTITAVPEDVKHSLRTWTDEEKARVRKALLKTGRFTARDIDNWIDSVNGLAATIAADKTRLDFEASDVQTMLKPNQEYKFTVDASTLCAKRLLYQGTFNAIQHLLPNTVLTSEDLIDLSNTMREMGYETPCGICYVESRRRHLDKFAGEWIDEYDGEYKPTLADVTTTDGLESLRLSEDPAKQKAYEDFVAAMKGKGVANPKVVELRTEYRGEIAKLHPMTVRNLINHGGLRLQSFSDFETPHLLDMIQVVMDMAGKGLTSQAYTKVPNFAWAFGDTGVKINLSLIGKGTGVNENGNLLFDDVEGMPFEEAMKLRDRYSKNVGTILVGINDDHIIAAMADNRIDFIIPFHKSGWSKTELERMPVLNGYDDYTDSQNEKKIKARKADGSGYDTYSADDYKVKNFEPVGQKKANGKGTDGYWDFSKTGRENAETYLEMCAKDGRVPKFSQFLVDNGDGTFSLPQGDDARSTAIREGYWKTLIDFKMYDNDGAGSPQTAVTPNVNMAQAQRILDEYSLDRNGITRENNNDLPVANPVVERFVEEYRAKHQDVKHSLPELEHEYEEATREGNKDWQAQVVQQAAHAAGYTTGAYHGSNETEIDEFNTRSEDTKKQKLQLLFGTHFTQNRQYAEIYAKKAKNSKGTSRLTSKSGRIYDVYLDLGKSLDLQKAKNYTPDTEMFRLYNDLPANIRKKHKPLTFSAYDTEQGLGSGDFVNARIIEEALQEMSPKDATEFLVSHGYNSVLYNANYNMGMANNAFGRDPSIIMLDPERIKSAEPETYDDNGKLIPLGERFNRQKNSIRYSLPSDAPYMAAVERGEMDQAQEDVNLSAERVMENSKIRDEDGNLLVVYHGTTEDFTVFDMNKGRSTMDIQGAFFSPYDIEAGGYGDRVGSYFLNITNPAPEGVAYAALNRFKGQNEAGKKAREYLISEGYDGVANYDEYIAFYPEQIKSADPVTYDDQGNVIPLSERFQTNNPDVRYALPSDNILRDQMNQYLANGGSIPNEQPVAPQEEVPQRQRQFGYQTAQRSDDLHKRVKDYLYKNSSYTPDTNQAQVDRAISWMEGHANNEDYDGYYGAVAEVESPDFDYRSADGQARMMVMMAAAASRGDVATELRLADAYNRQGTDLGQQLQARKLFRLMTPVGRRLMLQQMAAKINQQYADQGQNRKVELPEFLLLAAEKAENEDDFQRVRKAAAQELAAQMPANWKEKLTAWRMLSMLGNPRTHVRNILGNAIFMPAVGLKNKIGAGLETIFLDDGERSKTLGLANSESRAFAKQDAKTMKDILTGEAKYKEGDQVQRERKPFKSKVLQAISDINGNALELEDWVFLQRHYRNALAGYMTANKLTADDMKGDTLNAARAYAVQEAQKATYRDANAVASWLNEAQRKHPGIGFFVNAVLPFKKTPANILKRGVEYSPVGLIDAFTRGTKQVMMYQNAVKNGTAIPEKAVSPTQYIDKIASGLSGTAIMALGAALSAMGAATAGLDDDEDEFKKLQGEQEYAINPGKILNGIFHTDLFGEDVSFTMDWAAPVCMPFFVGVTIMDEIQKQAADENREIDIAGVLDSILGITEPVFNLSMLDGVNNVLQTSQYAEGNAITQIGESILTNYATSYVPTFVGQVARTIDTTRRRSFVESGAKMATPRYAWEGLENKIPYLSTTNIPYRDVWGNADTSGRAEAAIENFISPGYANQIKDDAVVKELERIYHETGNASVIPKAASKTVGNEKLNAERYDQYVVDRGQTAYQTLQGLMESPLWQICDDDTRAAMISDAWTYANAIAKSNLQGGKVDSWIMNASTNGNVVDAIFDRAAEKNQKNYISGYGQAFAEAIDNDDVEAMETSLQALEDAGATDTQIKGSIRDYFKPLYQAAFMRGDRTTMTEIEDKVVEFTAGLGKKGHLSYEDISTWVPGAEEEEEDKEENWYSWLNTER